MEYEKKNDDHQIWKGGEGGGEEEGNTCHEYMMLVFEGK